MGVGAGLYMCDVVKKFTFAISSPDEFLSVGVTCVKWGSIVSRFIGLLSGIRQGGVLSPHFFAIYIDSVVKKISNSNIDCYMKYFCMSILYADGILLVAPSVTSLQQLLHLCEQELARLDMPLNVKKSACTRVVVVLTLKPISHHRLRPDKTVLSGRRRRYEQSWRQFSVVFDSF